MFFAGTGYDLLGYVIMPSHIHYVFQPLESWIGQLPDDGRSPRERIVHSLNRHTASQCNLFLGRTGAFWQHESYDHWIRDPDELERILLYIDGNPVKAGLVRCAEDFLFSSAFERKRRGLELGEPLVGPVSNRP